MNNPCWVAGIIHFSEVEVFASIEVYKRMLIEILITGLDKVRLRLQVFVFRLVELRDVRLAVLVFCLHQQESILCTQHGLL